MNTKKLPGGKTGQDWPELWPHLDESNLTDEGEKIKLAVTHIKNIQEYARGVQFFLHCSSGKNTLIGLTEIILRCDGAIADLTGASIEEEGVLL